MKKGIHKDKNLLLQLRIKFKIHGFKIFKYAWQRVVREYDERLFWGLDDYFNQIIPALKEYCLFYLCQKESVGVERIEIYKETLKRIEAFEKMTYEDFYKYPNQSSELWEYVGKNISWYWD